MVQYYGLRGSFGAFCQTYFCGNEIMNRYTVHQIIASFCVAIFIVSVALILLCENRSIYSKCYEEYYKEQQEQSEDTAKAMISEFEAKINYEHLADGFTSFFGNDYEFSGYDIAEANVSKLKELKPFYRGAWVLALLSFGFGLRSFMILSKRRQYMPLIYGGTLAAFLTVMNTFFIVSSKDGILFAIRNMIFKGDYSFFAEGDILLGMLPPDFARMLLLAYIVIVFILILVMVLVRWFINYCGRPHKF